jgi:hypothetical protein
MIKKTIITHGRAGLEFRRAELARAHSLGTAQAIEHVVERLAGGFLKIVDVMTLREIVAECLGDVDLGELNSIKHLPGVTFACANSLMAWWMSGLDEREFLHVPRMQALFALERAVEEKLPAHMRKPTEMVEMACDRIALVPRLFGQITFKGMTDLHPVWRPVVLALASVNGYTLRWDCGPLKRPEWLTGFPQGALAFTETAPCAPGLFAETAANAEHEVLEAFRWAFSLMAQGFKAEDIAIATVSVSAYQELVYTLSKNSDIKLHMSHGVAALQTSGGQECAALADILIRGISLKRVKRLVEIVGFNGAFAELPLDWAKRIPQDASLLTVGRWKATLRRKDMEDVRDVLDPVVTALAAGVGAAPSLGRRFLSEEGRILWNRALQNGPASALDHTLRGMRVRTAGSSLDSVCFMSAQDLVASPRKFVRLIGLHSGAWPRKQSEDPLIPEYIVPTRRLTPMSVAELDRRDFGSIIATTSESVIFSWPRLDGEGRELRASTLVPSEIARSATALTRSRKTRYPASERDRLFMSPQDYAIRPEAVRAFTASRNWRLNELTAHDGSVTPNHPRLEAVFSQVQSATSLQRMIRDPLGFVWRYALGFHAPEYEDEPLLVDQRVFGNIVHSILKASVEKLNKKGNFSTLALSVIKTEVAKARADVAYRMEQSQPIPPALIWTQTLDRAEAAALVGLTYDYGAIPGQITHAEVPFGSNREWIPEDLPWSLDQDVFIPGTGIRVMGIIDRLDRTLQSSVARVIDYKNGKTPSKPETIGIKGGLELQRAIYGFAVDTLLGDVETIESALFFPLTSTYVPMEDISKHMQEVAEAVAIAQQVLRDGHAYPGVSANEEFNDMLFAFPARATSVYLEKKQALASVAFEGLRKVWEAA